MVKRMVVGLRGGDGCVNHSCACATNVQAARSDLSTAAESHESRKSHESHICVPAHLGQRNNVNWLHLTPSHSLQVQLLGEQSSTDLSNASTPIL